MSGVRITAKTARRYMVGKTIASVEVVPMTSTAGRPAHSVETIVFTDGSVLVVSTTECPSEYATEMMRYRMEQEAEA